MRVLVKVTVVFAAFLFAATANAQIGGGGGPGGGGGGGSPGLIKQFNAKQIADLITAQGFQSQVKSATQVDIKFADGVPGYALGISCLVKDPNTCMGVRLMVGFNNANDGADLEWTNAWNSQFFFVRSYIDKEHQALWFVMDVYLDGGVSPDNIKQSATKFISAVAQASDFKP